MRAPLPLPPAPPADPGAPGDPGALSPPSTPDRLAVQVIQRSGDVTVQVAGEIDLLTAPQVARALTEALHRRPGALRVDLTAVTFLSAAGLSACADARRQARAQHVRWHLRLADRPVMRRILAITGLDAALAAEFVPGGGSEA